MKTSLSKPLIITGLLFQLIGIVWSFVAGWQSSTLKSFFGETNWPVYLGFILMLVAVIQAWPKKDRPPAQPVNPDRQ
ncbi:MAG: hypothetical protein ACM3NH_04780 [Candidatus Saccharibacteria bacterium]